jgi:hypothetical protein
LPAGAASSGRFGNLRHADPRPIGYIKMWIYIKMRI